MKPFSPDILAKDANNLPVFPFDYAWMEPGVFDAMGEVIRTASAKALAPWLDAHAVWFQTAPTSRWFSSALTRSDDLALEHLSRSPLMAQMAGSWAIRVGWQSDPALLGRFCKAFPGVTGFALPDRNPLILQWAERGFWNLLAVAEKAGENLAPPGVGNAVQVFIQKFIENFSVNGGDGEDGLWLREMAKSHPLWTAPMQLRPLNGSGPGHFVVEHLACAFEGNGHHPREFVDGLCFAIEHFGWSMSDPLLIDSRGHYEGVESWQQGWSKRGSTSGVAEALQEFELSVRIPKATHEASPRIRL